MHRLPRQNIRSFLVFFATALLFCAFFSCTPQTEQRSFTAEYVEESNTLKKETEQRRRTLSWTDAMRHPEEAENGDSQPDESLKMFFSDKIRMPTNSFDENVYPSMPDLGEMDVSKMSSALYSKLTNFLTGMKNKSIKSSDSVFKEKYVGVVFLYELGFYPDISSWYIGSPFIAMNNGSDLEDVYEIPVLLFGKTGRFNCWISIDASKASQDEFVIKSIVLGDLL